MVKPVIYKRNEKGSALTFTEVDASLQNLKDATISIAVTGSDTIVNDLNDTTTLTAVDGIAITSSGSNQTINFDASVLQDSTPQLGGNLDVNGYKIVSTSNGDIELDPNGTGKVIISGDLQVDGTTTTINSTTLDVDDKNITLAKGAVNAAAADGGGITLEGPTTPATLLYEDTDDSWNFNKDLGMGNNDVKDVSGLQFNTVTEQDHDLGRVYWDPVDGTLAVGMEYDEVVARVGHNMFYHVKNQSGVTIYKGEAVMAVGTVGASGQITCAKAVADGSVNARYILGIAAMDMIDGADGYVLHFGRLKGVDTQGTSAADWTNGTVLWLNPLVAGGLTDQEPQAPNLKIAIAYVVNAAANGTMFVRSNTGYTVADLHDVRITSPSNAQALVYNSSLGVWQNSSINTDLVNDTTPQLGGDLDVNGHKITSADQIDLEVTDGGAIQIKDNDSADDDSGRVYLRPGTNGSKIELDGDNIRVGSGGSGGVSISAKDGRKLTINGGFWAESSSRMALEFNEKNITVRDGTNDDSGILNLEGNGIQFLPSTTLGVNIIGSTSGYTPSPIQLTVMRTGSTAGSLIKLESGANGNIILTPDQAGKVKIDNNYWPNIDGNNGDLLITDGSGNLSWSSPAGIGLSPSISYTLDATSTSLGDAYVSLVGSDASTDSVRLVAGAGIGIEITDSNTITFTGKLLTTWDDLGNLTWDDLG